MQKQKFKFLFFIAFLLTSKCIISMEDRPFRPHATDFEDEIEYDAPRHGGNEDDDNNTIECKLCYDETNQFTRLSCGHYEYCNECLRQLLDTAFSQNQLEQVRCPDPDCQENLTEEDFEAMQPFAGREIEKIKQKVADNARPVQIERADWRTAARLHFVSTPCPDCGLRVIRSEGCAHMKCQNQNCNQHFCYICGGVWGPNGYTYHSSCKLIGPLKTGAKVAAAAALAGYAGYKLGKGIISAKNWFSKKYPNLSQKIKATTSKVQTYVNSKSHILVPAAASTGLFALLTAARTNLSQPILNFAYRKLGDERFTNIMHLNPFGSLLREGIENKHVVNAGLSLTGGLLAGAGYKLFSGSTYKPKNRPRPFIKK